MKIKKTLACVPQTAFTAVFSFNNDVLATTRAMFAFFFNDFLVVALIICAYIHDHIATLLRATPINECAVSSGHIF